MKHWKARFGMIHPRVCCDMEIYDFYQVSPPDVVLVTTNLEVADSARCEEVEASLALVERATQRLMLSGVDFILMNGLPLLLYHGYEGHQRLLDQMRSVATVPITTAAQSLVDAFNCLGAKRILMISSWRSESTHLVENFKSFLAAARIEIAAIDGIGGQFRSYEKNRIVPSELYQRVLSVARSHRDFDAIFIQSGTLATVGILDALEQAIAVPVIGSNCANTWACFRPFGIKVGPGYGRLLSSL